jgi:hypothetical protein
MSKRLGRIAVAIVEPLKNTTDRALSISNISRHAFALNGAEPTRSQQLSATRAAHRLIRRTALVETKIVDAVVADQSAREADQDWRESRKPWPIRHLSDG